MEIEYKDLPLWAKQSIEDFLPHKRPRVHVIVGEMVKLGPVWHDSCQRRIVMYQNGETKAVDSCYYDSILNATKVELTVHQGGSGQLSPNSMLLEILTYPPSARLYVRPENMPEQVNAPSAILTEFQFMVLSSYVCYSSGGRKDSIDRYHIPRAMFAAATTEFATLGLVKITGTGAGATMKGRNLYNDNRNNHRSWYSWADQFEMNDSTKWKYVSKAGSWVAAIIEEYKAKRIK